MIKARGWIKIIFVSKPANLALPNKMYFLNPGNITWLKICYMYKKKAYLQHV